MRKYTFTRCLGLMIALQICFMAFGLAPSASAASISVPAPMSKIVSTEHTTISSKQCNEIKQEAPTHASDPNVCTITTTHTLVGTSTLISRINSTTMRLQPDVNSASCSSGGATATAYDDLTYSYLWKEELYTVFHYYSQGCTPTLTKIQGYVKYAIVGLTSLSQSTGSYKSGANYNTGVENIVSTNGLFGAGVQFSSCQSRSLDGYGDWPYYSDLYAQDC